MKTSSVSDALRGIANIAFLVPFILTMAAGQAYAQSAQAAGPVSQPPGRLVPLALQQMQARYNAYHHIQPAAPVPRSAGPKSAYDAIVAPAIAAVRARAAAAGSGLAAAPRTADTATDPAASIPGFVLPIYTPTFSQQFNVPFNFAALTVDVNQDGLPDLVTLQSDGTLHVLLNPGKGKLSSIALSSTNVSAVALGVNIYYAVAADLNGDGYPDIEALDTANNAEVIFLNDQKGGFKDAFSVPIAFSDGATFSSGGGQPLFADVNGDKIPDMVCVGFKIAADYTTTAVHFLVYPGKGDGTFGSPYPDQVITFQGQIASTVGQNLLQDINKDGAPDLVIELSGYDSNGNSYAFVSTALNSGKGVFSGFPTTFPTTGAVVTNAAAGSAPYNMYGGLEVADLNGDGNPDILFPAFVYSNTPPYGFYTLFSALGNADGTFQTPVSQIGGGAIDSDEGMIVNYADVNGDGILDAIFYGPALQVFKGKGGGAFSSTPYIQFAAGYALTTQPQPADFNGDGSVTLATVDWLTGFASFFTPVNGVYSAPAALSPTSTSAYWQFAQGVADLNGDGAPDIIMADTLHQAYTNNATWFGILSALNDGKGNFTYKTVLTGADAAKENVNAVLPVLRDLNGDGKVDMLVSTGQSYLGQGTGLAILPGNGDGTFSAAVNLTLGQPIACDIVEAASGDMNGDGFPDIVVPYPGDASCEGGSPLAQTVPSGIFVLLNDGKGNFTSTFTPFGFALGTLKLIDFNGDGKLDIATADYDISDSFYYLYVIPGNGDGTLNTAGATEPMANAVITSIFPGDFDGDGNQDLTVGVFGLLDSSGQLTSYSSTGVYMLKGRGDFTFDLPIQYASGTWPVGGAYADLNGHGYPDLVMNMRSFNGTSSDYLPVGSFSYLVNHGDGSFGSLQQTPTPYLNRTAMFVADFNGDGAPDVLQDNDATGLFMNAGGIRIGLTASASSIPQDTNVTLTATLTPSFSTAAPTGSISFYDNGNLIESLPVSGKAVALSLSTLPAGTNAITATYSGDSNLNAATTSKAVKLTVTPLTPDFSFGGATPTGLSLTSGQTGTVSLAVSGNATFNGTVALTCSGAPSEAACTVSPTRVTLAGAQSSIVTVVIATTAPNNTATVVNNLPAWMKTTGGMSLAGMIFAFWPVKRRRLSSLWTIVLLVSLGITGAATLSGCGGSSSPQYKFPGTPTGTSTITLTGISGGVSHNVTFTLTVE